MLDAVLTAFGGQRIVTCT